MSTLNSTQKIATGSQTTKKSRQTANGRKQQRRRKLTLEQLEDRRLLYGPHPLSHYMLEFDPGVPDAGRLNVQIAGRTDTELAAFDASLTLDSDAASGVGRYVARPDAGLRNDGRDASSELFVASPVQFAASGDTLLRIAASPVSSAAGSPMSSDAAAGITLDRLVLIDDGGAASGANLPDAPVQIIAPPIPIGPDTDSTVATWGGIGDAAARLGLTISPAEAAAAASSSSLLANRESGASDAAPVSVVDVGWFGAVPQDSNGIPDLAPGPDDPMATAGSAPGEITTGVVADAPSPVLGPMADEMLATVGFEPVDGFNTGFIGGQMGWTVFSGNTSQPVVSTANPAGGSQHVRVAQQAGLSGNVGAVSPSFGTRPAGHYVVSLDVAVSGKGGSSFYISPFSSSQGAATAYLVLYQTGDIYVYDNGGGGLGWYDTGADWTTGSYRAVTIDMDATANTIKYSYGGSLIYTGAVWGGTSVERVRFYGDNAGTQFGDFDNLTVQGLGLPQPDLVTAQLTNWNDSIPIGVTQLAGGDPHTYDGPYYSNQTLYFNWVSWNLGTWQADNYTVRVQVATTGGGSWNWNWTNVSTAAGSSVYLTNDQAVGPLAAGTHTFRIWLDYNDTVAEPDELNNYYERTITVLPAGAPSAQDVTAEPWGISAGVSWFQVDGQVTDFGGEKVYAADLVAGQRVSASVQTPEFGGLEYLNSAYVAIPDGGAVASSEITVSGSLTISDLDVALWIDHRNTSDLNIFLVSPSGTRIELSTDNGGTGNHYLNTIFDDQAATAITAGAAPFWGRYRPETPLSVLNGTDAAGTWRLEVQDDTAGNSPDGLLRGWAIRVNQGLDAALTITAPDGSVLAANGSAMSGVRDAAVVSVTAPTTGRYLFKVGNQNLNVGSYTLEAGIYDASVPNEGGDTTDLDPVRAANGNVAVLGLGDGIGQEDLYTITLNAGEAVNVAGSTPGGFYSPQIRVVGPGGFDPGLPYGGPNLDTVQMFTAPTTGTYTITVKYALASNYVDVISTGSYALTVSLSDTANNDTAATARPISTFDYQNPVPGTSWLYGTTGPQGVWRGTIDPAGEADWFAIGQLEAGQLIRAYVQREGASQVFPAVLLVDSSNQIVVGSGPLRSPGLEGIAYFETIVGQADDYYLVVVGDATVSGGSTWSSGAYHLFYADFGVTEDAYEQNDSKEQVDGRPVGAANSPNLGVVGQVTKIDNLAMMEDTEDWFRFQTTSTGTRGDYVRIQFAHAKGNLNLDLLDADGNLLRRSQEIGDNELVTLHGLAAGTYYARVWGHNGARNPQYSLRIQSGAPDQRLISPPYTTDAAYAFSYQIGADAGSSSVTLQSGVNQLVITTASGGAEPFEMIFPVTRVGSMAEQEDYQYDALGNLSRRTDALGRDTVYQFDALGRISWADGPALGDATQFEYDANGNLTQMIDLGVGTTEYEYDELDRLTKIIMPNGLGTVQYGYDAAGRVASITYPDGSSVGYAYNAAGQLWTVIDGSDVTTYTYNAAGQLATMTMPNGVLATYVFDQYGRLTELAYTKDAAVVTSFHYTLDANGNRTQMDVTRASGTASYGYGYDALNRLVRAEYPDGSVVLYTYDDNGNRLSTSTDPDGAGPQPAVVENYHYGYDNRLESITDPGGTMVKRFEYDPRGNVVLMVTPTDTTRYEYDYRNLLTIVENSTTRTEYVYDGNGDRVAQFVNGVRTNFVNDPNRDYTQVLAELNSAGVAQSRYTYGLGRVAGQLPGQANPAYYVADALGSTTDLVDPTGTVLNSYGYDAFGALRMPSPAGGSEAVANSFLFTGEQSEAASGIGYLRARYYDSATGRFLSKDPANFDDGANLYVYVSNNPTNLVDPSGRSWKDLDPNYGNWGGNNWSGGRKIKAGEVGDSNVPAKDSLDALYKQHDLASYRALQLKDAAARERGIQQADQDLARGLRAIPSDPKKWDSPPSNAWWAGTHRWLASIWFNDTGSNRSSNQSKSGDSGRWDTFSSWDDYRNYPWFPPPGGGGASSYNRGGVLLNRAVDFVGDLKQITGATVDPATGQVVLLGTTGGGATIPDLLLDDFVSAVRAVFGSPEDPGVTIDPQSTNTSVPQLVHLFGGLDNSDMGYVLFEADRQMKSLAARKDNITGNAVSSSVPGYKSMLDRWFDRARANGGSGDNSASSRFWFVPNDVKLVRSDDGQSFVFDRAAVQLMTEDMLVGNGNVDPDAQAFADWFNANFDAIANEAYAYPSLAGYQHAFRRLEQAARAVAFARFLYDNRIDIDFSWMEHFQTTFVATPATTPTVVNSRTESWNSGNTHYTLTITISGGVTMETPNTYVAGSPGMQSLVLGARPSELAQQWSATVDGQTQQAVALSLDTSFVDGLSSRADTDLAYQTPGDIPFGLTRYYSSAEPQPGVLGYGWEFVPLDLDFTRPAFISSDRAPQAWQDLNGLHEGEVRVVNRATGRVLTFESSLITARIDGNFLYGGLNAQGVPDFTPGGSERPDGSTLVQDPATLQYTLTRPDGTQAVFDPQGRLLQLLDSRDRAIAYGYADGRVTSISDSAGQTITLVYASGRVTQAQGLGGEVVNYTYTTDGLGNLARADRVRGGDHSKWIYTYNATASPDDDHLLHRVTPPNGVLESRSWSDIFGRTTAQGDARGNLVQNTFDPESRITVTRDTQDNSTQVVQTDSLGRPRAVKDQLGRITQYYYDVERVFGPQYPGGWTYVQYINGTSRQPSLILTPDPGRAWIFATYDDRGNLVKLEDIARGGDADRDGIDDHPQLFEYDAASNLVRHTDARGLVTTYTYETLQAGEPGEQITNRPTSTTRAVGTPHEATTTWQYDPATGYLQRQTDPTGVATEYTYDAKGNVLTVTVAPGTANQVTTTYTYDAFSRRTSVTDSAGRRTEFDYNGRDQMTTTRLVGTSNLIASSTYDAATGRKLTDTDFLGNVTANNYDTATGDLTSQTAGVGTADESTTDLRYDRFGNVERVIDPVGNVTLFEYDRLQRLVAKTSLGSTLRVVSAVGSNTGITVGFSEAIAAALVDNGSDIFVKNSLGQTVTGGFSFAPDGKRLTWTAQGGPLAKDTYTVTLRASAAGQFTAVGGQLLDGEYFGALPSGDNMAAGDFDFAWYVDDHGNAALHSTAVLVPSSTPGELEYTTDQDWFRVNVVAGTRLQFEVVLGSEPGSLYNSELALYAPDGTTVLQTNDDIDAARGQYGSRIDYEVQTSGAYYLKVTSFSSWYTGTYQLNANVLSDDHPDDPPGTLIAIPSMTAGTLEVATDRDTFSFDAAAGTTYRITPIHGTLDDSALTLLDIDGTTVLATNDNYYNGNTAAFLYWTAPAAGRYHVQVASPDGQDAGTYELAFSVDDHGDWFGAATAVAVPSQTEGDLEVKYDPDWFSFTAVAGSFYRFTAEAITLPDPFLAVFDSVQMLAYNDNYHGPDAKLFWQAPSSGTFYLKVTGHEGTGQYALGVTELVDDHGNDAAQATLVTIPSSTPGNIEMPSDSDWFAYDVAEGLRYRIESVLETLADSVLTLYAADGLTQLGQNDDFRGPGSRLDFSAAETGRLYASVTSRNAAYDGTYQFHVLQLETDPPTGVLIAPAPGSTVSVDAGYVDVLWSDGDGSGIDPVTVDKSDIQVTGVTVTAVSDLGDGVWRYAYEGSLADGAVTVSLLANRVSDLHGNWNAAHSDTFEFAGPALTLSLADNSIAETAGPGATTATVTRINVSDLSSELTITLINSDDTEITLPGMVTIPANQASVMFPVDAVDDALVDGTQTVTVTASAIGFRSASGILQITDHGDLAVVIAAASFFENAGPGATTATVFRSDGDDLSVPLEVTLTSSDTSEAAVASSVIIPAHATSTGFAIDAVDDDVYDGTQTVTITASATGFHPGSDTVDVLDWETIPPALSSNPGAPATLYLDFDGHYQAVWGSFTNLTTPVFDLDLVPNLFTTGELAAITQIWQRVAEDYAPFNIDVTTVDPGDFSNGKAMRIAIGGSSADWFEPQGGGPAGGVAYLDSFTNSLPNVAYVFPEMLSRHGKYVAEASSHEAGHTFGLRHQSLYDANGNLVEEYHPGDANWAPIMGNSYYAVRSTWHNGPDDLGSTHYQYDLAMLAGTTNGFGYRADDHGDTTTTATALSGQDVQKTAAGILHSTADKDYFRFTTGEGQIALAVNPASVGPNLDSRLELRDAAGVLVAAADPGASLSASLTADVATGEYYAVVASHGGYGDLGQYTLFVDVNAYLVLTIDPDTIPENGGTATATLTRVNSDLSQPLTVTVTNSDTSEADVPPTVIFAVDEPTITFTVTAVEDADFDGPQTVILTASAAGFVSGSSSLIVSDTTAPSITGVTSSVADGAYGVAGVIPIQIVFDGPVVVTGTPQLTLETGDVDRIVNYTTGSGTTTLVFEYTVQAGDTSSDLDYLSSDALMLNGGDIESTAGISAVLTLSDPGTAGSLGYNKDLVIDGIAPWVGHIATVNIGAEQAGQTTYHFTVEFVDNVAIGVSSLDGDDIAVTGPNGFTQNARFDSVTPSDDGTPRTVTYQITPPGGSWDDTDSGTYTIALNANQVFDTAGNAAAANASLATFTVDIQPLGTLAATLVSGTLTIADTDADGVPNAMTVRRVGDDLVIEDAGEQFAGAPEGGTLSNGSQTLTIPLGLITGSLVVNLGGGDDVLTVDFAGGSPVPPGGLRYDGGAGDDLLRVLGSGTENVTYTPSSTTFGDGAVVVDARTIAFTGLEPTDYDNVGTFTLSLPNGDDVVQIAAGTLAGDPASDALVFTGTSGGVAIESAHVRNTTNVVLNTTASDGDDTITVTGADNDHGNTNLTILTGTGADTVSINGNVALATDGTLAIETRTINVAANAGIAVTGDGAVQFTATRNITLASGSSITAVDGDITLSANQQLTPTAGNFIGIDLYGALLKTTGGGNIALTGRGGDTDSDNYGIQLRIGAVVESTAVGATAGAITIDGTGGAGTSYNRGVFITGSTTRVTAVDGDIQITGQGGDGSSGWNDGVRIALAAGVSSTGTDANAAKITIDGTGGAGTSSNRGVGITSSGTLVTSVGGDIQITGQGGDGSESFNEGVEITYSAVVSSTGMDANAAKIAIHGTGGAGTNYNQGVYISDGTQVTSVDGDIQITGQGGDGSSSFNPGVRISFGGIVSSTGTGSDAARITIDGTGGAGTANNYGVWMNVSGTRVTSVAGDIQITGQGGAGSGFANYGVRLSDRGLVSSTGTGAAAATITIDGTGGGIGGSSNNNQGVRIESADGRVSSADGDISITGRAGVGNSIAIELLDSDAMEVTGTADITLTGDSMDIAATNAVAAGGSIVTLQPLTAGTLIDLGGADVLSGSPRTLGLTDAELDRITAGTLTIGNAGSGQMNITAPISRSVATDVNLISGGAIVFDPGSIDAAGGDLSLAPGTEVRPLTAGTDATVDTVSFAAGAKLAIRIDGTTADTEYSQLSVAGAVDLTGAVLALSGSHSPAIGEQFTIVNNLGTDPVIGTFAGLPEGAVISNFLGSGRTAVISYEGGDGNDVVLTVDYLTEVRLVARKVASSSDTAFDEDQLPSSDSEVNAGGTFFVEVWIQDIHRKVGFTGGTVTLTNTTAAAQAQTLYHGTIYSSLFTSGTIDNPNDQVRDFGGGTLAGGHGAAPKWARLGYVQYTATAGGTIDFESSQGFLQFSLFGGGNVAWPDVNFGSVSLTSVPQLSIAGVTQAEGDADTTDFDFVVTLSHPSNQEVTVAYTTQDGTATVDDSDYQFTADTLTFAPGQTQKTITVPVIGDLKVEDDETFSMILSDPTNATITQATATGTITNDDAAVISISDPSVTEGGVLEFVVTISSPVDVAVTADRATADGTATTGDSDYTPLPAANETLFAAGSAAPLTIACRRRTTTRWS
jgi:RHS repeat-associated protein